MDLTGLFNSIPGLFVTQSFFHALLATVVAEMAIRVFRIESPSSRQRIFFAVILFPVLSFPLFQLTDPARNSATFRLGAVFDSGRWLNMEVLGYSPGRIGLLLVFGITSVSFLIQEFLPVARHALEPRRPADPPRNPPGSRPGLDDVLGRLPADRPRIVLLEDDDPVIFSATGGNAAIYLSTGLLGKLTGEQLLAALAHEMAHVARSRRPLLLAIFVLRMIMFFNPPVLVAFRRAVQEDEKICDEAAVSMTGNPGALADTLRLLYLRPGDAGPGEGKETVLGMMEDLERRSHRMNVESRVRGIERGYGPPSGAGWAALASTVAVAAVIGYFVV